MGFFSWITQDSNESILNSYCCSEQHLPMITVYMTDNKGKVWKEENYEGYGVFGGKDYYELLAEMNGLKSDRDEGINLAFSESSNVLYPNLNKYPTSKWNEGQPKNCPYQGYFVPYEEEEGDLDYEFNY